MSEVETHLPLQLCQREIHGIVPQLYTNLKHLRELIKDNFVEKAPADISEIGFGELMGEHSNDNHALEISKILFWIATNHPDILDDDSKVLTDISINCLYFRESWDHMDEFLPKDALMTLLCSKVCKNLIKFCGYINPIYLENARLTNLKDIRLAIGSHNVHTFCDSLNSITLNYVDIAIHLRCGEVDLENLTPILSSRLSVRISNASDQDVDWVWQAAVALTHEGEDLNGLFLSGSTLTAVGVEALAKGFTEAGIELVTFTVSSPHIEYNIEIPEFGALDNFIETIQEKYNLLLCVMTDQDYEQEFLEEVWLVESESFYDSQISWG